MAVGLDGNWYITPGNMWQGPINKYDPDFKFFPRGKIKTKGKGDIEMWFVEKAN